MIKLQAILLLILASLTPFYLSAQEPVTWHGHLCAVALTYDDGLDIDLDNVLPALDAMGFKGTFYVNGNATALQARLEEWRQAAAHGHELGNHTLFHPCLGSPSRAWLQPERDMNHYTIDRIVDEIRQANVLLQAIDGQTVRSFAYTCGDDHIGDTSFADLIRQDFVAARSVSYTSGRKADLDLMHLPTFTVQGHTGEQLIEVVRQAMRDQALVTFLFHGVGGGHSMNIELEEHRKLLEFLKAHEDEIWVAPVVEIAKELTVKN